MLSRDEVTIITANGGAATVPENNFRPEIDKLAKGSRIPAVAAIFVGTSAASVLHSVAGDPDEADAPGLIPIAWNPPVGNHPMSAGGAHGSTAAIADADNVNIPAPAADDAAKANPDAPKVATKAEAVDTGQLFVARAKGGRWGVTNSRGDWLSKDRYDTGNEAVAAYTHPAPKRK